MGDGGRRGYQAAQTKVVSREHAKMSRRVERATGGRIVRMVSNRKAPNSKDLSGKCLIDGCHVAPRDHQISRLAEHVSEIGYRVASRGGSNSRGTKCPRLFPVSCNSQRME